MRRIRLGTNLISGCYETSKLDAERFQSQISFPSTTQSSVARNWIKSAIGLNKQLISYLNVTFTSFFDFVASCRRRALFCSSTCPIQTHVLASNLFDLIRGRIGCRYIDTLKVRKVFIGRHFRWHEFNQTPYLVTLWMVYVSCWIRSVEVQCFCVQVVRLGFGRDDLLSRHISGLLWQTEVFLARIKLYKE